MHGSNSTLGMDVEAAYFNSAKKAEGSWWPIWISWLAANSGEFKKPSELNVKNFEVLYEAPGQYVKQS